MSARQNRRRRWAHVKAASDGRLWAPEGSRVVRETRTLNRATEALKHGGPVTTEERNALATSVFRAMESRAEQTVAAQIHAEEYGRQIESRHARQSAIAKPVRHIAKTPASLSPIAYDALGADIRII